MKTTRTLSLFFLFLLFLSCNFQQSKEIVEVENIKVVSCASNCKEVKGMIRNISDKPIKGSVKIKFLDANGDIVYTARAYVNDGDPIKPNQAGSFSYATSPNDFNGVVDFDVIFIKR